MVLGICLEGNFGVAMSALEVESVDADAQVGLVHHSLLAHVELRTDVYVVTARVATHAAQQEQVEDS